MHFNIAHRGAHMHQPENTMEAFKEARRVGAHGSEMDVRLNASEDVVVCHDSDLNQISSGKSNQLVRDSDVSLLRKYHVPLLREVLEWQPEDQNLLVELKFEKGGHENLPEKTLALCRQFAPQLDRIFLISFHAPYLEQLRKSDQSIQLGLTYQKNNGDLCIERSKKKEHCFLNLVTLHVDLVGKALVESLKQENLLVGVWGITEEIRDVRKSIAYGIDFLITDIPDKVQVLLQEGTP